MQMFSAAKICSVLVCSVLFFFGVVVLLVVFSILFGKKLCGIITVVVGLCAVFPGASLSYRILRRGEVSSAVVASISLYLASSCMQDACAAGSSEASIPSEVKW